MKAVENKRILDSGVLMMRETWPYGLGEVIGNVLSPIVNRIVFMVLLLANFRYYSKRVTPEMNYSEVLGLLQPILWSVLAVMLLPLCIEALILFSKRFRLAKTDDELIARYCFILFGSSEINEDWKDFFQGQVLILEYLVFLAALAPIFLYYSWPIYINLFVVTNLFVIICSLKVNPDSRSFMAKIMRTQFYVPTMKNLFFCIYLLICALIIWLFPDRFPVEFIFLLIVSMRMLLRKASSLATMLRSGQLSINEEKKSRMEGSVD